MNIADWGIMLATLLGIAGYGIWKTRHVQSAQSYMLGDNDLKWWTIGLSIMATQASAITFLSTPGQAYESGMAFVQFYFGLPLAMVLLSIFVIPNYYRLKVYTAYEYLESRFGLPTRLLTAALFLIQRGLAAGMTILAPSIVLSQIMGWSLNWTIILMGVVVIAYTVSGGTKAVSVTQTQQMVVILLGLVLASVLIIANLPGEFSLGETVAIAGKMDKLNVLDFEFDLSNRYNFWSGMLGGTFLFLSYFGTDQSQVSRYLSGRSLTESRLGLMFNGLLKIPMQFVILFVGILVFVFYQFNAPPAHFNRSNVEAIKGTKYEARYIELEGQLNWVFQERQEAIRTMVQAERSGDEDAVALAKTLVLSLQEEDKKLREEIRLLIKANNAKANVKDTDYVFISYVLQYMPVGVVGLLLAMIFSAAWSSTSSELNALSTTVVVDIYRRVFVKNADDKHYLRMSKWFTVMWGGVALAFAILAQQFENLIQAVNIIGSLFYGVILGVFLTAFFLKRVGGRAVFLAAILSEILVIGIFLANEYQWQWAVMGKVIQIRIAYLWLNLIGCGLVMILAAALQGIIKKAPPAAIG
jgi:SSS family solute:Na+ symporter